MWNQDLYNETLSFAANAHLSQKVPGTNYPYIVHLVCVCDEILAALSYSSHFNINLAMQCALLHDTIEDTGIIFQDLVNKFGSDVARGVEALTKNKKLIKENQMTDSLNRIKQNPPEIGMVKMADRITNLQKPPAFWNNNKIKLYHEEAKFIFEELNHLHDYLGNRLKSKIDNYLNYLD